MATSLINDPHATSDYRIKSGGPWSNAWKIAAVFGAAGVAASVVGFTVDKTHFAFSYLFAFYVPLTIALGSLFFLLMQHLTGAHWSVSIRRIAEFFASGLPVFAILVIPVILQAKVLYPWFDRHEESSEQADHTEHEKHARPTEHHAPHPTGQAYADHQQARYDAALERAEEEEHAHVLEGKTPFLNPKFFGIRAILYVVIWGALGFWFFKTSTSQDAAGHDASKRFAPTLSAQKLAPIATLLFGATLTLAGIDWLMSLDPMWYSTMWGVYIFAGSTVAMFAVLILTLLSLGRAGLLGNVVTIEHYHDLGKLQFGFLVFWAYISFSQFFLIWYSNIPEETTFFHLRWDAGSGTWQTVSLALVFGHFVIPFAVLLSRNTKRKLQTLALGALIILVMHVVELYWVVMPNFAHGAFDPHWMDAACLAAVSGIYLAVVFKNMTTHPLVAVGDPRLSRAIHHET